MNIYLYLLGCVNSIKNIKIIILWIIKLYVLSISIREYTYQIISIFSLYIIFCYITDQNEIRSDEQLSTNILSFRFYFSALCVDFARKRVRRKREINLDGRTCSLKASRLPAFKALLFISSLIPSCSSSTNVSFSKLWLSGAGPLKKRVTKCNRV